MYLLTFTFLIIGMLSIYTQVAAVEAARLYASQSGIAQSMVLWHEAAASLAGNVIETSSISPVTGCSLTVPGATPWLTPPPACTSGIHVLPPSATVTVKGSALTYTYPTAPAASVVIYPNLPPGYDTTGTYYWKSVAYLTGTSYYVVTYVDPPATPGGFISTATTQLGITQPDLFQQIKNTGIPIDAYGYVSVGNLNTFAVLPGATNAISYPVPASIPTGALAIISAPGQCSGC